MTRFQFIRLACFLLLSAVLLTGCKSDAGTASTSKNTSKDREMTTEPFGIEPLEPAPEARDEDLGIRTIKGKLARTKGAQAMVDGVLISNDFIRDPKSKLWKSEIEALLGKMVEVRGSINRHWCGPMEQCLSQGYIDSMHDIEFFRAP